MVKDIDRLASINSGTSNLAGIERVADIAAQRLATIGAAVERLRLSEVESIDDTGHPAKFTPARAVVARVRSNAATRVLLNIHLDTVYGPSHPFQNVTRLKGNRLHGPGVLDAKGGLVVLLYALEAFEQLALAQRIGWTVVLNPDEEIGSLASEALLTDEAADHAIGLVFEPALPDGAWIGERRGSGNFTLVMHGRSAHAGRDFESGRNAVHAAGRAMDRLAGLTDSSRGVTLNIAKITGGGPSNVVPDLAVARFNVRVTEPRDVPALRGNIERVTKAAATELGCRAELHGGFSAPPKPMTSGLEAMRTRVARAAARVGLTYVDRASGGVCDGNRLAAAGCPCIDTMGPVGDGMHSTDEWLDINSLAPRASVALGVLADLASETRP